MPQLNVTGAGLCTLGATASALVKPAEAWRFTGANPIPTHLDAARTTPRDTMPRPQDGGRHPAAELDRDDLYDERAEPERARGSGAGLVLVAVGGVAAILAALFFALTAPRDPSPMVPSGGAPRSTAQPAALVAEPPREAAAIPPSPPASDAQARPPLRADTGPALAEDAAAAQAPAEDPRVVWTIVSEPAGAEVWLDDQKVGVTPHLVRLERGDQAHQLRLRLEGFEEARWSQTPREDRLLSRRLKAIPKKPRWRPRPAPAPAPPAEPEADPPTPVEEPDDGKRSKLKKVLLD